MIRRAAEIRDSHCVHGVARQSLGGPSRSRLVPCGTDGRFAPLDHAPR
jgi:hypothetical protein